MESVINQHDCLKLHVGCGRNYFTGWINIDNNSDHNIDKLDLNLDLRVPLPFDDGSADFIYNEHFLEHLTVAEGLRTLSEFRRVLKPNGVLRVAMPDLDDVVRQYFDPDWREQKWLHKYGYTYVKTPAELINLNFREWGHKYLYNREELKRRLMEAGFVTVHFKNIYESDYEALKNLETREESLLICEAIR
jgi:predicted SAM-dependent methyltransferase